MTTSKKHSQIQHKLTKWLRHEAWSERILVKEEVPSTIDDFRMRADVVTIKAKSNTLHVYEVKTNLRPSSTNAVLWQLNSYYSNYKSLVISKEVFRQLKYTKEYEKIIKYGVGVVVYSGNQRITFKRVRRAKYREGNYLKYWPSVLSNRKDL